jgi:hypothetical protein
LASRDSLLKMAEGMDVDAPAVVRDKKRFEVKKVRI